jgi:DNA repair exonuclease SbcCD nuclease subunit
MKKILFVGDMHVVPEEIGECQKLLDYTLSLAVKNQAIVCFLGDQHHTHSIVRVETLRFWRKNFVAFKEKSIEVIALVGNHDLSNANSLEEHAMLAYEDLVCVVDSPKIIPSINKHFLFMPYYSNNQDFVEIVNSKFAENTHTVICHQTFNGAMYEKGFYAKDGIDVTSIPQKTIISGHIHSYSQTNKLLYVGSPRWRTLSDANIDKSLFLVSYSEDGVIQETEQFSTEHVCKKILFLKEEELALQSNLSSEKQKIYLTIEDNKEELIRKKDFYSNLGFLVRGVVKNLKKEIVVRESDGIKKAFEKYFQYATPFLKTNSQALSELVRERIFGDFYANE